ncbi:hypothetical protein QYF36_000166 [Acer negundo]|nr:hypothetical protein QYF36_000166 [Acer negundo]
MVSNFHRKAKKANNRDHKTGQAQEQGMTKQPKSENKQTQNQPASHKLKTKPKQGQLKQNTDNTSLNSKQQAGSET